MGSWTPCRVGRLYALSGRSYLDVFQTSSGCTCSAPVLLGELRSFAADVEHSGCETVNLMVQVSLARYITRR